MENKRNKRKNAVNACFDDKQGFQINETQIKS